MDIQKLFPSFRLSTEDKQRQYAQRITKLFYNNNLKMLIISIPRLGVMVRALDEHKSECPEIIAIFKSLLLRKYQVELNQSHSYSLERIYYEMIHQKKGKAEAQRFKAWFQKLRRVKYYSIFPDSDFYCRMRREPEETEDMRVNFRYFEKLMREDLKKFTSIIVSLTQTNRVNYYRMPVEHLNRFMEGMAKYKNMPDFYQEMKITLAYKKEYLNLLSEEEIQKNKVFLEERYESLVEKNPDRNEAQYFRTKFTHIELLDQKYFEDGLYIRGKLLKSLKKERKKQQQCTQQISKIPSKIKITPLIFHDQWMNFQSFWEFTQNKRVKEQLDSKLQFTQNKRVKEQLDSKLQLI